jgi:hypothetical protein
VIGVGWGDNNSASGDKYADAILFEQGIMMMMPVMHMGTDMQI